MKKGWGLNGVGSIAYAYPVRIHGKVFSALPTQSREVYRGCREVEPWARMTGRTMSHRFKAMLLEASEDASK